MRLLGVVLASLLAFGQSAAAGTLRYELAPVDLILVSASQDGVDVSVSDAVQYGRLDPLLAPGEGFNRYRFIEFETAFLPFSLRNTEFSFQTGRLTVRDQTGIVFEEDYGRDIQFSFDSISWLNGLTGATAYYDYRLSFDDNGDIFDWNVEFDDDKPIYTSSPVGSEIFLYVNDGLYSHLPSGSYADALWVSNQTQTWTRTGTVPFAPSAIPLPASGILLLAALGLTVASRRRKIH